MTADAEESCAEDTPDRAEKAPSSDNQPQQFLLKRFMQAVRCQSQRARDKYTIRVTYGRGNESRMKRKDKKIKADQTSWPRSHRAELLTSHSLPLITRLYISLRHPLHGRPAQSSRCPSDTTTGLQAPTTTAPLTQANLEYLTVQLELNEGIGYSQKLDDEAERALEQARRHMLRPPIVGAEELQAALEEVKENDRVKRVEMEADRRQQQMAKERGRVWGGILWMIQRGFKNTHGRRVSRNTDQGGPSNPNANAPEPNSSNNHYNNALHDPDAWPNFCTRFGMRPTDVLHARASRASEERQAMAVELWLEGTS